MAVLQEKYCTFGFVKCFYAYTTAWNSQQKSSIEEKTPWYNIPYSFGGSSPSLPCTLVHVLYQSVQWTNLPPSPPACCGELHCNNNNTVHWCVNNGGIDILDYYNLLYQRRVFTEGRAYMKCLPTSSLSWIYNLKVKWDKYLELDKTQLFHDFFCRATVSVI